MVEWASGGCQSLFGKPEARKENQNFTQGVVQGFEQLRAVYKPQNPSFEDFYESLESFALMKSQLGDPSTADKSNTRSHPEKTGKAQNPPRQQQTLKHPTAQQVLLCASEAVYEQRDYRDESIRQDPRSLESSGPGKWREIRGVGRWKIRVYDTASKAEHVL